MSKKTIRWYELQSSTLNKMRWHFIHLKQGSISKDIFIEVIVELLKKHDEKDRELIHKIYSEFIEKLEEYNEKNK